MDQLPIKIFPQSGVLPLLGDKVVLVTARSTGNWIIPKGHVEPGLTPSDSAAKEAYEEAGIIGRIMGDEIGTYRYQKPAGLYTVSVFPFAVEQVLDEWLEQGMRQRRMVSPEEAIGMIVQDGLREVLQRFFDGRGGC